MSKLILPLHVKITKARGVRKMTQKQVAKAIGFSVQGYADIELGRRVIATERVYELAEVLNMDPNEFFETQKEKGAFSLIDVDSNDPIGAIVYERARNGSKVYKMRIEGSRRWAIREGIGIGLLELHGYETGEDVEAKIARGDNTPLKVIQRDKQTGQGPKWYSVRDWNVHMKDMKHG